MKILMPGVRVMCFSSSIFSVVAAGPIGLWLLRNYRLTGLLSGMDRDPAARTKLFEQRVFEEPGAGQGGQSGGLGDGDHIVILV